MYVALLTPLLVSATRFDTFTTSCGATVITVENATESSLTLAGFLSPTQERTFVYGDWDAASDSWRSPQWVATKPFVYADVIQVDSSIDASVTWERDSMNRVTANGIYFHVSSEDAAPLPS